MTQPIRVLLQTTIPTTEDDWSIWRFSLLQNYLASVKDEVGNPIFQVTARDRTTDAEGNDPVLSTLDRSNFDELWLFALDLGEGLSEKDCAGIRRFRQSGGSILTTRDHQDMGCSMCDLADVGAVHFFQSKNQDPDVSRHCIDDPYTSYISWPNYHSGANGDYQKITRTPAANALFASTTSPSGFIEYFPSHPHEGAVGVPEGLENAQVMAMGKSLVTNRSFNLVVAQESYTDSQGNSFGRAIATSSFHHFVDYNWDTSKGCPTFVDEPPGEGMKTNPQALEDIQTFVKNAALWLAGKSIN